jgi:hypothetical protein
MGICHPARIESMATVWHLRPLYMSTKLQSPVAIKRLVCISCLQFVAHLRSGDEGAVGCSSHPLIFCAVSGNLLFLLASV